MANQRISAAIEFLDVAVRAIAACTRRTHLARLHQDAERLLHLLEVAA